MFKFISFIFLVNIYLFAQESYPLLDYYKNERVKPNLILDDVNQIRFVKYFDKDDADLFHKAIFEDGRLKVGFDSHYSTDKTRARPHSIFALDVDDNLFICDCNSINEVHHSSLVQGRPVKAAGEMVIVDGIIVQMNNKSGHYKPSFKSLEYLKKVLREQGYEWSEYVHLSEVDIDMRSMKAKLPLKLPNPCVLPFFPF